VILLLWSLVKIELSKMFHRPRTYIGLLGAALIPAAIIIIFCFRDPTPFLAKALGNMFTLSGSVRNGYLVALTVLNQGTMNFFAPVLVVLVAGEIIAGEREQGTLKMLLTRPIHRNQLLIAKLITVCIYTLLLVVIMAVIGIGIGTLIFGQGSLFVSGLFFGEEGWFNIVNPGEALWKLLIVYGLAFLVMLTITTFSFLLSTGLTSPVAATVLPLVTIIFFRIISNFPYLEEIKPFLFTTHMDVWIDILAPRIEWGKIMKSLGILGVHALTFTGASILIFHRKDVLS